MKSTFAILSLLTCFSLAAQETPGLIDVTAEASVSIEPEFLRMQISIDAEALTPEEAQKTLMEHGRKVLNYLNNRSDLSHIETDRILLQPRQTYQKSAEKIYHAQQSILFQIDEIRAYEEITPRLLALGVTGISGPRPGSSQESKYETLLLQEAMHQAREKAVLLAAQLEQEIGPAVYISDMFSQGSPRPNGAMQLRSSSAEPSIQPGKIELQARVNVHFELK